MRAIQQSMRCVKHVFQRVRKGVEAASLVSDIFGPMLPLVGRGAILGTGAALGLAWGAASLAVCGVPKAELPVPTPVIEQVADNVAAPVYPQRQSRIIFILPGEYEA